MCHEMAEVRVGREKTGIGVELGLPDCPACPHLEAFAAVLGMDATDISMDDHIFLLCLIREHTT
jgi:hypothetical protein